MNCTNGRRNHRREKLLGFTLRQFVVRRKVIIGKAQSKPIFARHNWLPKAVANSGPGCVIGKGTQPTR